MAHIIIYTKKYCPYCSKAKHLLEQKNQSYNEYAIDQDAALRDEMIKKSGRTTVPQIFINGQHIGGCDDLHALEARGTLDTLLKG